MGHYYSEIDPSGAQTHAEWIARIVRLKERVRDVPLSQLHVHHLPCLHALFTVMERPALEDVEELEEHLDRLGL